MFKKPEQPKDMELFVVYDSKTESYTEPLPMINSLDATREFLNAFMAPDAAIKNRYFKNAEDFSLFKIASYHRKSGTLEAHQPTHVVNFHELKSQALRESQRQQPGALSST